MSAARELAQLLQNVTTRAEQAPGSRNRPITLYATSYEDVMFTVDTESATVKTPPFRWADPADPTNVSRLIWGQGQWR